ncbi:MAG: Sec-independent protein translocase protein TatB [Burkholderiales bacterium]
MFDIGISEIFVIGVVALVVVGPERLPRVAKTVGHLLGRLQRYVGDVKADINREIELDELRKLQSTVQDAANSVQQTIGAQVNFIESEVKQAGTQVEQHVEAAVAPIRGIELMSAASPAAAPAPAITTEPVAAAGPVATTAQDADAATGNVTKS